MTEDQTALARRAVACRGWRWLPAMRWVVTRSAPLEDYAGRTCERGLPPVGPGLPDLTDPATLGCLLALVREAWGAPSTVVVPLSGNRWGVAIPNVLRESPRYKGDTEAEALVAALEASLTA